MKFKNERRERVKKVEIVEGSAQISRTPRTNG
jgi:hypothetical protein